MKEKENTPTFVWRDGMIANKEYVEWLTTIKERLQKCQIKTAIQINSAMLEFYWSLGRDLVEKKADQVWGSGVVKQLSLDLRATFPEIKGLSAVNLYLMRRWYLFYQQAIKDTPELFYQAGKISLLPHDFAMVPWRHHTEIISRCESVEEALFYIHKTIEEGWSRSMLDRKLAIGLYQAQSKAITNFAEKLPSLQSCLAQQILKDPYDFSFLNIKEDYNERDLENALVDNITRFLLELGRGFSFVGRQMELQMPGGQTFFPDLVFYYIPQHRYVVIELKAVKYVPEFAGKLNFYVTAADELLKGEGDNPSVGLIICKSADKTVVEWSLSGIDKPLGVAAYQLQEVVDRTVAELKSRARQKY